MSLQAATQRLVAPDAVRELAELETALGGRPALIGLLALAPLNKDGKRFLALLAEPSNAGTPLAQVCAQGATLPGDLVTWVTTGMTLKAQVLARALIAARTPAVVQEVMQQAATWEDTCPTCLGLAKTTPEPTEAQPNPASVPCATCQGHGVVRVSADPECRRYALDMAGLLPKSGGISITNQALAIAAPGAVGSEVDRLQEAMDQVLYGHGPGPRVIDAEVVPPQDPQ